MLGPGRWVRGELFKKQAFQDVGRGGGVSMDRHPGRVPSRGRASAELWTWSLGSPGP